MSYFSHSGVNVPRHFRSRERKFHMVTWERKFQLPYLTTIHVAFFMPFSKFRRANNISHGLIHPYVYKFLPKQKQFSSN